MDSSSQQSFLRSENCLISLENVEKRYRGMLVLSIDGFTLERGDIVALFGQNGSGKSTLLRVLAGITPVSTGRFYRSSAMEGLRIAYVPQSGGVYPNLTVIENLRLYSRLYNQDLDPNIKNYWYVAGFGLDHFLHYPVSDLSGGYQKIASIACALSVQPEGLFLDEPFTGLDVQHATLLGDNLETMHGHLVFLVATGHSPEDLRSCNKKYMLLAGKFA